MTRDQLRSLSSGLLLFSLALACGKTRSEAEPTGRVTLSITSAPADAACLRITAKGATTATRLLPLMVGQNTVFALGGLPLGPVEFTGEAFPLPCPMLTGNTAATYVSEVVQAVLIDGETVDITLALRRPGRANVSVDFPDGGALPNGAPCSASGACASGFCASGVCCNSACLSPCQRCNLMPAPGTCSLVPAGTTCGPGLCMGTTRIPPGTCDSGGSCVSPPAQSCAPFVCQNGACRTDCASNADCQAGFTCRMGQCASAGLPNGSACAAGAECASGFCSGGVCCNSSCTGPCQACNIMPGACVPRPAGTVCGPASCSGSTQTPPPVCNGAGACTTIAPRSCAPYLCQGSACGTSCASDAQCQMGFVCRSGQCLGGGLPNGSMCGGGSECASGFCVDGFCCNSACDGACLSCNRAGSTGTCSPDAAGVTCAAPSCTGATFTPPASCNGMGMCVTRPPVDCRPYLCGASACRTSCASSADCQMGFTCQAGACVSAGMPVTIGAEADAFVRDGGSAALNFGSDPTLLVKNSTAAGNHRISYLRFPLGAVTTVSGARLRLYGSRAMASMLTDAAFAVPTPMWSETGITWNNRPALGAKLGAGLVVGATPQYHEWDVTAFVQAQRMAGMTSISFAVHMETATGNSPDSFSAREAGSNPPQLVVIP